MIKSPLLSVLWDVDPLVFSNFPYLRWYSICWGVGLFLALLVLQHIYRRDLKPQEDLNSLAVYLIIGIIIGARLGHVIFYEPSYYWNNPIEILPIRTDPHFQFIGFYGLASHGGVLGALVAIGLFKRKHGGSILWLLERLMIAGVLLGACIRIGNLLNSEIIGTVTNVPWAFVFKSMDLLPRHPSQLYEALAYLGVFAFLFQLWKRKTFKSNGPLFGMGIAMVFAMRFFIEFFKVDQVAFEQGMRLNMGQWLSIPLIILGIAVFIMKRNSIASFHQDESFQ